jgi:phage replication O-like protein O
VLLAVIRKTYGYGKKEDDISLSQLEKITGIPRTHCCKSLNELVSLNAIIKSKGSFGQVLGINKHYRTWANWDVSWEHWGKGDNQKTSQANSDYQEQPKKAESTKKEPKPKPPKFDWRTLETPSCINRTAWENWNTEREANRKSVSEFSLLAAIEGMTKVHAAGGDVIAAMVASIGWAAFNADWALKAQGKAPQAPQKKVIESRIADFNGNFGSIKKAGSIESTCTVIQEPAQFLTH